MFGSRGCGLLVNPRKPPLPTQRSERHSSGRQVDYVNAATCIRHPDHAGARLLFPGRLVRADRPIPQALARGRILDRVRIRCLGNVVHALHGGGPFRSASTAHTHWTDRAVAHAGPCDLGDPSVSDRERRDAQRFSPLQPRRMAHLVGSLLQRDVPWDGGLAVKLHASGRSRNAALRMASVRGQRTGAHTDAARASVKEARWPT
jgi:hypothetical protein